jgi:PhoH-like ATPase
MEGTLMPKKQKHYLLDTNVLLTDPNCLYKFQEHTLILPVYVLEEVDKFKSRSDETGRNARFVSRLLREVVSRKSTTHKKYQPFIESYTVDFPEAHEKAKIRFCFLTKKWFEDHADSNWNLSYMDDRFIAITKIFQEKDPKKEYVIVTNDNNLSIRAEIFGVPTESYKADIRDNYTNSFEFEVGRDFLDEFYLKQSAPVLKQWEDTLFENAFVTLKCGQQSALCRVKKNTLHRVSETNCFGIRPRNREQTFALDVLLDPTVQLVTVSGKAGTGKTLLCLATALQETLEEQAYSKILVARPVIPMGKDLGYLPGSIEEKVGPWMKPIYDNLETLLKGSEQDGEGNYAELTSMNVLQVEPLTYIRGRSIPNQFIIIDESQNLTAHEAKTILTRAGEGTKIVMTGDPDQIDHPYLNKRNNGLTHVAHNFKGDPVHAHVNLVKGERSFLAEKAANLL